LNIDVVQLARIFLELRVSFENHVILVELRIQRIDLALSECVVQRVVDGRRRDAEARSGGAINDQGFGYASQLLIGDHVRQFRQLLQPGDKIMRH
jgi:hypothetical protein